MSCSSCKSAKPLNQCVEVLTIGTIAVNNHPVYVWLNNKTTGQLMQFAVTSSNEGLVTVDLSAVDLQEGHLYEIFVTNRNAWIGDKIDVTVGATPYDCFQLSFKQTNVEPTNQTISV
jgi:hypothetical protein